MKQKLSAGVVHPLSKEITHAISSNKLVDLWESLTALGRNEYICWITSAKKDATRNKRINWMISDLQKGKRRPCCRAGCTHREKNGTKSIDI